MRRLVQTKQRRAAVMSVMLAAIACCGIVFFPGASGASPQLAAAVQPSPTGSFQLLREAASGTPPASVAQAVQRAPSGFGLDIQGARQAAKTGVWLIPGSSEMCIAVQDSEGLGMSCASGAVADSGGLAFVEHSTNGGPSTVVGAAPDGATQAIAHSSDGAAIASPVQGNTYVVSGQGVTGATPSP